MMSVSNRMDIPLLVVGCDFRSANASFREMLVATPDERRELYRNLTSIEPGAGLAVLETCNRVEWLVSTENPSWLAELLAARITKRWRDAFEAAPKLPLPCVYSGRQAALHVLRVVAGLESLAAGESQIAGQVQDALHRARKEKTSSAILNGLAKHAGRLAKAGQKLGYRADQQRGIHGLTAQFLRQILAAQAGRGPVVVVGMGAIGRKAADVIEQHGGRPVVRINRTVEAEHEGLWLRWEELPGVLSNAQALVVATGALEPVITEALFAQRLADQPLPVVDIGSPRQVSREAQQLACVRYYSLDSLVEFGYGADGPALAQPMEQEVEQELELFKRYCIERDLVTLLRDTQLRREEYMFQQIPAIIDEQFSDLGEQARQQLEQAMRQLISRFSRDSFESIHNVVEQHWSEL